MGNLAAKYYKKQLQFFNPVYLLLIFLRREIVLLRKQLTRLYQNNYK